MGLPIVDLLLLTWIVLASLNGARRGGIAEGIVGAGLVVTGALVIAPPVDAIAACGHGAATVVVGTCLGIGIGVGAWAVRRLQPSAAGRWNRVVGSLCGALNGLWIAIYLLAERQYRFSAELHEQWLAGSHIAPRLIAHVELILLGISSSVLLVSGLYAIIAVWNRLGANPIDRGDWRHRGLALSGARGVRLPARADAGKLDPARERGHFLVEYNRCSRTTRIESRSSVRRPLERRSGFGGDQLPTSSDRWYRIVPVPTGSSHPPDESAPKSATT